LTGRTARATITRRSGHRHRDDIERPSAQEGLAMFDRRAMTHAIAAVHQPRVVHAVAWLAAALLILAIAAPVYAARPTRGCSDSKVVMARDDFRQLSIDVGVPPELLFTPVWEAGWASYDKNGDTNLCVGDKPDTPGHLGTWLWNVTDNTANH
jgi:hypothetical protein